MYLKSLVDKMSRTEAMELNVSKNGTRVKTFSKDFTCDGSDKDVSALLDVLHKTKETANDFLTTLVEADKAAATTGGVVTSHSKRKNDDDGE